jgi:cell division protein FtsB
VADEGLADDCGELRLSMAHVRGRRRSRRRIARWVALGVAVLLALLYYRPVRTYVDTRHTLHVRTAEVRALSMRKRQLEERLAEIRSGGRLVRGARRLGLVEPGEHLFIVRGIPAWRRAHSRSR